ncbi:hypothetical protein H2200_011808 [Cladophialophora chaetospira]|uniref:Heterokaryon incompatibility domain-containing protein n=1 Tax=Cladophialophora chaetospira TaxID=386627 RepID=A0AA39CCX4_9EURO|nr:hypothetical protein H2200_011808 [Cladophialophora chaetospira]
MYCFPYPQGTKIEPLKVPYIASCKYSLKGPYNFEQFYEYAVHLALFESVTALLGTGRPSKSTGDPLVSGLQAWLFFGLASEALGRDIAHREFVEDDRDGVSTGSIDLRIPSWFWFELKARWDKLRDTLSPAAYERKKKHLKKCSDLALIVLCHSDLKQEVHHRQDIGLVLLSVHMLLYLIAHQLGYETCLRTAPQSRPTQILLQRMTGNGWCRKRLNFIDVVDVFYPSLYFMSSLQPPRSQNEDHRMCTAADCRVSGDLRSPNHRTNHCRCRDVHVPLKRVNEIVADGGIPLIRVSHQPSGDMRLEVIPYTRTCLFTAVSHVWSDRQLGSTKNALPRCQLEHLDSVVGKLPRTVEHFRLRDWISMRSSSGGDIEPPSHTYQLFWLDTFCIPQDEQHADLKRKAIQSMNLIYATAAHTLVFDKGLQLFDAGKQPSSLCHGGRSTFYAPTNEKMLDTLAQICASKWMSRAWTLQEGVLSGHLVFPFDGSMAYLRLLRLQLSSRSSTSSAKNPVEPFRDDLSHQFHKFLKSSLHVDEHRDYARDQTDRAARFVKAHSFLQSRSTTQPEDIPLILVNMSGMNGNLVSQAKGTDERMKLLFYGLGILPAELLFSDCARTGRSSEVDSWIPQEVALEKFRGDCTLHLGPEGFAFQHKGDAQAMKFYLLSSLSARRDQFHFCASDRSNKTKTKYLVQALTTSSTQSPTGSDMSWCMLINDNAWDIRGARFVISRIDGNKIFLHFDCPLRLSQVEDASAIGVTDQLPTCIGHSACSEQQFIIQKSETPQTLGSSRPQNPEQYSDRLIVVHQVLWWGLTYSQRYFSNGLLDKLCSNSTLFMILWFLVVSWQHHLVEQGLHAFVHRAWMKTYDPGWNQGQWKWFWQLSNYKPPIPFKTMMMYYCKIAFSISFMMDMWPMVAMITLYWIPLYPRDDLVGMYVLSVLFKGFYLLIR